MHIPYLGLGVVYVPGLEPLMESGNTCIDVLEIEPQPLWHFRKSARNPYVMPASTLSHLNEFSQRKIVHSVGFAPGGTYRNPPELVDALVSAIESLDAPLVSEHLSYTHVRSEGKTLHTGFMLPPLQTRKGARIASANIRAFGEQLPVPLAIETTVNYLKPRRGEMSDGEFVATVVEEADCGILLDLHNIWTNERNGRQTVESFLADIPLDRVWEVHLAGGFEIDGYWLDAHSGAVPQDVMAIAKEITPQLDNLRAIIYEIFPSFLPVFGLNNVQKQLEYIKEELSVLDDSQETAKYVSVEQAPCIDLGSAESKYDDVSEWEVCLAELVTSGKSERGVAQEMAADDAILLVRKLIWKFRAGAIIKSLNALSELIRISAGDDILERILDRYFDECPPQPFASEEAMQFIDYIQNQNLDIPFINDVSKYERCIIQSLLDNSNKYAVLEHDPRKILEALKSGDLPEQLERGSFELEVTP